MGTKTVFRKVGDRGEAADRNHRKKMAINSLWPKGLIASKIHVDTSATAIVFFI